MKKSLTLLFKVFFRIAFVLVLTVVTAVVATLAFLFATPEVDVTAPQVRWVLEKTLGQGKVAVDFKTLSLKIKRPQDRFFAKTVSLSTQGLCVKTENDAVNACFDDVELTVTGGWDGTKRELQSLSMPRLIDIAPIKLLGGDIKVDVWRFKKDETQTETKGFDYLGLFRKQILPVWRVDGSRIEIVNLALGMDEKSGYQGEAYLAAVKDQIEIELHHFHSLDDAFKVHGQVAITRPDSAHAWKVGAHATVVLPPDKADKKSVRRKIVLISDANVISEADLNFRLQAKIAGVAAVREARIAAEIKKSDLKGTFSLKVGQAGSQIKTLDFFNCGIRADLDKKIGGLRCGPETIRLEVQKQKLLNEPKLYVLRPQFDLEVSHLTFDKIKSAEFKFRGGLTHLGILNMKTDLDGSFESGGKDGLKYAVKGNIDFAIPAFQKWVKLFSETPYAVPAPLNTLDGTIGLKTQVAVDQTGGKISYQLAPSLDSDHQGVHMALTGDTTLTKTASGGLHPATRAVLAIDDLRLSLPRFDLAKPPRFKPDPRFGPIESKQAVADAKTKAAEEKPAPPMDFKLEIRTTHTNAIQIATNLTKAAVPISLDIVYVDTEKSKPEGVAMNQASSVRTLARSELDKTAQTPNTPVTGWVTIGTTPIDLFRRNAVVQEIRVDFLADGDQRLNGLISISYLEYAINVILVGRVKDPQVRFASDPPLEDNQVVSVLLFGRPLQELGDDEKSSVASLNAAFTDAVLSVSSLYFLASTPIESVGYDSEKQMVTARVGLGGGASVELGSGGDASGVGFRKRLSKDFTLRSDVETIGTTGKRTVSALIEWVKRF